MVVKSESNWFQNSSFEGSGEQTREVYEDEGDAEITYNPDQPECTTYFPVDENLTEDQIQTKCDTPAFVKFLCQTTCKFVPPTTTTTEYSGPPTTTTAAPVPRG